LGSIHRHDHEAIKKQNKVKKQRKMKTSRII